MVKFLAILIIAGIVMFIAGLEVRKAKQYSYGNGARNAAFTAFIGAVMVVSGIYLAVHEQMGS